jgi:hypothetical protein
MNKYYNEQGTEIKVPERKSNLQRRQDWVNEQRAKQTETPVEPKKPTQEEVDALAERLRNGDETAEQEAEELLSGKTKPVQPIEKKEPDQNALLNAYQNELDAMSKGKGSTPFLFSKVQEKYRALGLKI